LLKKPLAMARRVIFVRFARGAGPLDGVTDFINGEEGQTVSSRHQP
jgi:hypothetical protein